jgi:hypothetical protein
MNVHDGSTLNPDTETNVGCPHLFYEMEWPTGGWDQPTTVPLVFYVCALCGEQGYPVP